MVDPRRLGCCPICGATWARQEGMTGLVTRLIAICAGVPDGPGKPKVLALVSLQCPDCRTQFDPSTFQPRGENAQ
jgi:hypothetical protein